MGAELIATCPEGVVVVQMIEFKDRLFVATSHGVYIYDAGLLHPVPFVAEEPDAL